MNIHAQYKFPSLYQSRVTGPDSLFFGKWGKHLKAYSKCSKWIYNHPGDTQHVVSGYTIILVTPSM